MDRRVLAALAARVVADEIIPLFGARRGDVGDVVVHLERCFEKRLEEILVCPERLVRHLPRTPARLQGVSSPRPRPRGGVGGRVFERFASGHLRAARDARFHSASEPGLARPMLETAASPLLRAVASAFAHAEDAAHAALPLEGARARYDSRRIYARTPRETPSPRFSSTPRALERDRTEWPPKARRRFERSWNSRRGTRTRSARDGRPQSRSFCRVDALPIARRIRTRAKTPETLRRFARRFEPRTTTRSKVTIRIPKTSPFRIPKTSPFRVPKTSAWFEGVLLGARDVAVGATIARVAPNAAERRLGAWLSSDEGIAATNEVFSASTRLDTDEAIVFVDARGARPRAYISGPTPTRPPTETWRRARSSRLDRTRSRN